MFGGFQVGPFQPIPAFQQVTGEVAPAVEIVAAGIARRRRRRYIFPDGTQVMATPDEANQLLRRFVALRDPSVETESASGQKVKQKGKSAIRMPRVEVQAATFKRAADAQTDTYIAKLAKGAIFRPTEEFTAAVAMLKRRIDDEEALIALGL